MEKLYLYHYFEKENGPLLNLSSLSIEEAEIIQNKIRGKKEVFAANRPEWYIRRRKELEQTVRNKFIEKGGKPLTLYPQYFVVEKCDWLLSWYKKPVYIKIPINKMNTNEISFTYGDMFPTFSDKISDGKEYRKNVYVFEEMIELIKKYGLPQKWNRDGSLGPERYIEAQVWSNKIQVRV
jgi:hypothetical protein